MLRVGDTNQASIVSSSVIAVFWQSAPLTQLDAGNTLPLCQNNDRTLQHFSLIMNVLFLSSVALQQSNAQTRKPEMHFITRD